MESRNLVVRILHVLAHRRVRRGLDKTLECVVEHLVEHNFLQPVEHVGCYRVAVSDSRVDDGLDVGSLVCRDAPDLREGRNKPNVRGAGATRVYFVIFLESLLPHNSVLQYDSPKQP